MRMIERSACPENAIACFEKELHALGLTSHVTRLGTKVSTYRCFLYDDSQTEVSVGNGKGCGNQSKASALFEALEHMVSKAQHGQTEFEYTPISHIFSSPLLRMERVLTLLYKNNPYAHIPCRTYHCLTDSSTIRYPVFLASPGYARAPQPGDCFDYGNYTKYSTNNGTAIGLNQLEALIHAICELLERDAMACFLLKTYVAKLASSIKLIDKVTLPQELRSIISKVEKAVKSDLALVDITSDFGVPSFLALVRNGKWILPHVGAGASLNKGYAVERAVLEALQSYHLHDDALELEDQSILRKFRSLKRYCACVKLGFVAAHTTRIGYDDISIPDVPNGSLEMYLNKLLEMVAEKGYSVYYTTLYESTSGITCVHCVIPGLERFHLVRMGMAVVPSDRGMRLVNVSSSPAPCK